MRPDTSGFRQETTRQVGRDLRGVEGHLRNTNREFTRFGRGALVGTGALHELGRAAAFASLSFIGGAGIVVGIKSTISAAMDAQVVLGQTENAVKRSGLSWEQYGGQIQEAALAQAQISGFDDERLLRTFSTLIRRTGDVNQALKLNALAANVARGRNIELEQATQLVLKATLGQAGALRRLGIDAPKGASGIELIGLLSEKYAGSVEKFADTAAGAQARFAVAIQNTQEAIGMALLPTITRYLDKATEWLNNAENQQKIQNVVNDTVTVGATVMDTLAVAIGGVADAYRFLRDLPGGDKGVIGIIAGSGGIPGSYKLGEDIFRIADALGLVADETRDVASAEDLLWAARKRRALQPETGIWGMPFEVLHPPGAVTAASKKTGREGALGASFGSASLTRNQKTLTDLAAAQYKGQKAEIVAAVKARQAFVNDTIAFANRLIAQGRGDTPKLAQTLQQFSSEGEALNGILEEFAAAEQAAREKRIQDAKDRAAKWREDNHAFQVAFEDLRQQVKRFHQGFKDQVREEAAQAQARLELQQSIQIQILQNRLSAVALLPNAKKALEAQKTVQKVIVEWYRQRAKDTRLSTLERLQAQQDALQAEQAFRNLGKKEKKDAGGPWASREDFYAELQDEFAMYGSNIGPRGAPLSGQDSRASLAGVAKTHQTTVVQVFNYPVAASQALNDAKNAAKNLK